MKFDFKTEEINYIKILYRDFDGNIERIRAAFKSMNDNEILACSKTNIVSDIITPQDVMLNIICDNGLYYAETILKFVEKDDPYMFFALKTPSNFDFSQKREFFRILVNLKCICNSRFDSKINNIELKTVNLSANGICICSPKLFDFKNITDLDLFINNKKIETKVNYIRNGKFNEGYEISFSFAKISEHDRDFISQFCIQKQLEQRRNNLR